MIETPFKPIQIFNTVIEDNDKAIEDYHEIVKAWKENGLITQQTNESNEMWTDYHAPRHTHEYRLDTWANLCIDYFEDALTEFHETCHTGDLKYDEIWTQITKGFGTHHPHNHGQWGYSFVWYIDVDPEVHKPTCFYNPNHPFNFWQPEMKKGQLLIWPRWLLHYQPPSNSDVDRHIISGNIGEIGADE